MSAAYTDGYQSSRAFHRKPVAQPGTHTRIQPLTSIRPEQQPRTSSLQQASSHAHTRTASSGAFPPALTSAPQNSEPQQAQSHNSYQAYMSQHAPSTRRTLSNGTTSTSSTGGPPLPRKNSVASSTLQRSISSRSGNAPTSYVALMRKQKATVWCDRAQFEDPRVVAQQRAAKMRANMEVSGSNLTPGGRSSTSGGSSLTGGVRAKIRHHGAPKAQQYTPHTHPASGVPMRLSAREVDEEDSDDDNSATRNLHHRNSSGRSSTGSGGRMPSLQGTQTVTMGRSSNGGGTSPRPPPRQDTTSTESTTTNVKTPTPGQFKGPEYFPQQASRGRPSAHSSDNSEREDSFGKVSTLPQRVKNAGEGEREKMDLAELHRRGSVDERTMTMKGYGRLFVANPDVDD
ncbi:MAG: hypothetical protein M1828_002056 [Chrysothrix sp. TS-e1954]|nr:MAG: hypothetical protein M1828_002056 [Chrysothrix sp. TS-e1954]